MQRPGHKINTREPNPNEYITFIRALDNKRNKEEAEHLLKSVAAQVKRIMEKRFMLVGTLEEAEYNGVFAGRNWNHGQSIELVLRRPNGHFYPPSYLISVMCHEMAHITHMNHGKDFQKLNRDIKEDVARMQRQGNFGDGFWSDGIRLKDGALLGAEGLKPTEIPEYLCGVSHSDARKATRPRGRGPRSSRAPGLVKGEASHRSGRQTEYRRKAGRRVNVDMGEGGSRLDGKREITKEDRAARKAAIDRLVEKFVRDGYKLSTARTKASKKWGEDNPWYTQGSTYGKKAKSKTAAELRAEAAERRLAALNPKTEVMDDEEEEDELVSKEDVKPVFLLSDGSDDDDEIYEVDDPHLSIKERKRQLESEMTSDERNGLKGNWWQEIVDELESPPKPSRASSFRASSSKASPTRATPFWEDDSSDADFDNDEYVPASRSPPKRKATQDSSSSGRSSKRPNATVTAAPTPKFGAANLVREERLRALGLSATTSSSTARTLGESSTGRTGGAASRDSVNDVEIRSGSSPSNKRVQTVQLAHGGQGWQCYACTYINHADQGRCEMCHTRPDSTQAE